MKTYEFSIEIIDENYLDSLIVSLVKQGYELYYDSTEKRVCIQITDKELFEIKEEC